MTLREHPQQGFAGATATQTGDNGMPDFWTLRTTAMMSRTTPSLKAMAAHTVHDSGGKIEGCIYTRSLDTSKEDEHHN
jgi:hypothetical protein